MSTEQTAETFEAVPEVVSRTSAPTTPIEGWVTIETGQRGDKPSNGRLTHYMHGLVLPGMGKGRDRRTGDELPVPRNRFLLPDKQSYPWFKELMDMPKLPRELEGITMRMNVKHFLDNNIAFVRPSAYTLEQAKVEWKTRQLRKTNDTLSSMSVRDDKSLCHAFYCRGFKNGEVGTIARILPNDFKALVVMRNGFFYELSGAERLRQHIGRAGTNGMILDRDIEIALRHRQLFDLDKIKEMMDDPSGFQPEF